MPAVCQLLQQVICVFDGIDRSSDELRSAWLLGPVQLGALAVLRVGAAAARSNKSAGYT